MSIPQKDYIIPVLETLSDNEVWKTEEIVKEVYKEFEFDEDDLADMGYGHSRRYKNLNWAKTRLKKQGYIKKIKQGYWQITQQGIEYLRKMRQ